MKFTDDQLRAYIAALGEKFGFQVAVSDRPVHQDYSFIEFHGKMPRMRSEHTFIIPIENRIPGVITARSVLVNTSDNNMSWLLNGQASRNCREVVYIGASSDSCLSLHASKEMLRNWAHQNLPNIPDDRKEAAKRHFDDNYEHHLARGCYADDVCTGYYVDDPANKDTLNLKLVPVVGSSAEDTEELAETPAPRL